MSQALTSDESKQEAHSMLFFELQICHRIGTKIKFLIELEILPNLSVKLTDTNVFPEKLPSTLQ